MEKLFDFCYIAVNSAIILTILNYNINIYKLNKIKVPRLSIIIYIVVDNTKTNKKVLKSKKSR